MSDEPKLLATGSQVYSTPTAQPQIFTVPSEVYVLRMYGCGGGDGGHSGVTSHGYEVPGPGGAGGDGCVPHYWVEDGTDVISVNPGDQFKITIGTGGQSDRKGTPTIVTQKIPTTQAPGKHYTFGAGYGPVTPGGAGAASGRDSSRSGAHAPDTRNPGQYIPGGEGFITFRGNQDNHWGGGGGGGGAGMAPGGRGGNGGCDGGSQGGFQGGSHDPAFQIYHNGKTGANGAGPGAGGGGGGGGGDGADDHVWGEGAQGGVGGNGFLEIIW